MFAVGMLCGDDPRAQIALVIMQNIDGVFRCSPAGVTAGSPTLRP
jgi:hypothetical protein